MAPFNYARPQASADRMIKRYGQTGTVTRITKSGPAYDPVFTPQPYPCQLVVLDIDLSKVDGTLIEATDKMVYLSVAGLPIEVGTADKLVIAGKEHAIKIARPLSPAGVIVFYELIIAA